MMLYAPKRAVRSSVAGLGVDAIPAISAIVSIADPPGPPGLKKRSPGELLFPLDRKRVRARVTVWLPSASTEAPGWYAKGTSIEPQSRLGGASGGHADHVMLGHGFEAFAVVEGKAVAEEEKRQEQSASRMGKCCLLLGIIAAADR